MKKSASRTIIEKWARTKGAGMWDNVKTLMNPFSSPRARGVAATRTTAPLRENNVPGLGMPLLSKNQPQATGPSVAIRSEADAGTPVPSKAPAAPQSAQAPAKPKAKAPAVPGLAQAFRPSARK